MSEFEDIKIVIGKDGRIRVDLRGMSAESYRRVVDMLEETVGMVQEVEAGEEEEPPKVRELIEEKSDQDEEERLEH